jgi:hypothetical protein
VPAHAQDNDLGLEMTPFERILLGHDWHSFFFFFTSHNRSAFFLQHSQENGAGDRIPTTGQPQIQQDQPQADRNLPVMVH